MTVDGSPAMSPSVRPRSAVIGATVVLVATVAVIWGLLVPMEAVCPALNAAQPACSGADRRPAGVAWTVIVAALYLLTIAIALTLGRRRRWLTPSAVLVLVLFAITSIGAVQGAAGHVVRY